MEINHFQCVTKKRKTNVLKNRYHVSVEKQFDSITMQFIDSDTFSRVETIQHNNRLKEQSYLYSLPSIIIVK